MDLPKTITVEELCDFIGNVNSLSPTTFPFRFKIDDKMFQCGLGYPEFNHDVLAQIENDNHWQFIFSFETMQYVDIQREEEMNYQEFKHMLARKCGLKDDSVITLTYHMGLEEEPWEDIELFDENDIEPTLLEELKRWRDDMRAWPEEGED